MPTSAAMPEHRSILVVDTVGFSRHDRTDPIRLDVHRRLRALCETELTRAGVGADDRYSNETGDGFIWSISPSVPKPRLIRPLVPRLAKGLAAANRRRPANEQIRLRVAIHAGEVLRDGATLQGQAVIHACRLVDAEPVRACLRVTDRPLALIVSQIIYDSIVRHRYAGLDPDAFHPVIAAVKETRERGYVFVPGDHTAPQRAGVVAAGGAERGQPGSPAPPRELPAAVADFTDRWRELRQLDVLFGDGRDPTAPTVVVISGAGGVGKSALAVQAAHRLVAGFPDGQLYIDLHGASANVEPLAPAVVLWRFLRSLGLSESELPAASESVESASARYRSLLAGRRVLILLDNARDANQIRLLLPGGAACGVLITSRSRLGDLAGAAHVPLDALARDDAIELLRRQVGAGRIDADPAAAGAVARACDDFPLALRIAAARLRERPSWTVGTLASRLADEQRRLDQLEVGDLAVRASLETSYRDLAADTRGPPAGAVSDGVDAVKAFCTLGLVDGPDLGLGAAAALCGATEPTTEAALQRLVDVHLLENHTPDRYRFHDMIRLLAREHAVKEVPGAEQVAAVHRLLDFYLERAEAADRTLRGTGHKPQAGAGPSTFPVLDDHLDALGWLESEQANIVALVCRADGMWLPAGEIGRLAEAVSLFLRLRSQLDDGEKISRHVLAMALARRDRQVEAQAHNQLGLIARHRYRLAEATSAFRRSLTLFRTIGDRDGEQQARHNMGVVCQFRGRYDEARDHLEVSLAICRDLGDRLGEGRTQIALGIVDWRQDRPGEAIARYRLGLAICRESDDQRGESSAVNSMGKVLCQQRKFAEAIACYRRDLEICQELGDRQGAGTALHDLGDAERDRGDHPAAVSCYLRSLHQHRDVGYRRGQAQTLHCLGLALMALGHRDQATASWEDAAAIYDEIGAPEASEVRALIDAPVAPAPPAPPVGTLGP